MVEAQEYRYDVFISYSHADEAWAEGTLLPRLEGAGLRVCIDFRDFLPGKPALINMQDTVRDSRFTLLALTPDWVKSEWTLFESLLSRTKDPAGLQRRTIPLLLQACDLPDLIAMITWVDFTRSDRLEIAWRQLLTGLGVPPEPVAAPEPERPGWFLPHPYGAQPNFTGRAAERKMLRDWLERDPDHPLLVVRALGGFGKSALAWHWLGHDVDAARWRRAVWWSFYEGDNQFDSFLRGTVEYLLGSNDAGQSRSEWQLDRYLRSLGPRQQADLLLDFLRAILDHPPGPRGTGQIRSKQQLDEDLRGLNSRQRADLLLDLLRQELEYQLKFKGIGQIRSKRQFDEYLHNLDLRQQANLLLDFLPETLGYLFRPEGAGQIRSEQQLYDYLRNLSPDQQADLLLDFVRETLAYLLGTKGTGQIRSGRQLGEDLGSLDPRQQADLLLDFLREMLEYLLGPKGARQIRGGRQLDRYLRSLGPRQQADLLLDLLRQPDTLLILDGFERALRAFSSMTAAYQGDDAQESGNRGQESDGFHPSSSVLGQSERDCISPIAEYFLHRLVTLPGLRGKVLMTTRLLPRIVEGHGEALLLGCCERELTQMEPADAVAFFRGQGIRGARAEIEAACATYGCHPLSLRLLAGLVVNDLRQSGDIAAARRLDVSGDLIQRQHHVLEHAFESLSPNCQRLLSRIACFRGPVAYEALAALADTSLSSSNDPSTALRSTQSTVIRRNPGSRSTAEAGGQGGEDLDAALHDLLSRGLLHRDHKTNRFDLHPIVRRYAYDRLAGDDRAAAHTRLRDYFAAVPPPEWVRTLDDLAPVIELYHHTVRAGQYNEAITLFRNRIHDAIYYQFGAYQLQIELLASLFPGGHLSTGSGRATMPRLKDEAWQAWTLAALANSYKLSGQSARAVPLAEAHNCLREKAGDKKNFAIGLTNVADDQLKIGAMAAAEANLHRSIALGREIGDELYEAVSHQELGRLLAYRGTWAESARELDAALGLFEKEKEVQSQGAAWAHRALAALLMALDQSAIANPQSTITSARRALELADEDARTVSPVERDYVRAHWLLGAALRAGGVGANGCLPLQEADRHLTEALARCRAINLVEFEADILLNLARVRWDERSFAGAQDDKEKLREAAVRLAEDALSITERSGYVLQGADVHLFLAEIEIERGDRERTLAHAQAARRLATCDGPPDYTYKVAYDEAGALLAQLGESGG